MNWKDRFRDKYPCGLWIDVGVDKEKFIDKTDDILSFIQLTIEEEVKKERERKIKYNRIMGATDWLKNQYGLEDNDVLTAAEVEELLQDYIDSLKEEPNE